MVYSLCLPLQFSHLIDENSGSKFSQGTSQALSNKDNAGGVSLMFAFSTISDSSACTYWIVQFFLLVVTAVIRLTSQKNNLKVRLRSRVVFSHVREFHPLDFFNHVPPCFNGPWPSWRHVKSGI